MTFTSTIGWTNSLRAIISAGMLFLLSAASVPAQEGTRGFKSIDLVTNVFGRASFSDSRLVNPWGIAASPDGGPWWVADEGKGRATVYSGEGSPLPGLSPRSVIVPVNPGGVNDDASPTGVVLNESNDFELAPDAPARLIFVTRDGSIAGWNSDVDPTNAVPVVDNSPYAVYSGAAMAEWGGERALYAANFRQGRVEAFSSDFSPLLLRETAFVDPQVPYGFAPYNIRNVGGELYVTFARPRADGRAAASGEGLGYADIFDAQGNLVLRLQHGAWMNAPWGVALAPTGFGSLGNRLLVGNSGSGRISVFDRATGAYEGFMRDASGSALTIPDLHGLGFGNNGLAGPETVLYFTAGNEAGGQNVFGAVTPLTAASHLPQD